MIEVKNLTKRYGDKLAVDNVSFQIKKGEILGFLGPNGAGKTTVMNIITGYLSATSGSARVSDYDILEDPIQVKKRIGYLPEHPPLYMDMTVNEYLSFAYNLKKIKLDKKEHIAQVMALVKITHVQNRVIKNLSKGYKQRVGLAQALLGNPEFLILDEPTVGLDPKQIIEIRDVILKLGKTHTIMLSSHIMQEITAVCNRVIIINNGKIAASDTLENLASSQINPSKLIVSISGDNERVASLIKGITGVISVDVKKGTEQGTNEYTIQTDNDLDIREQLFYKLAEAKMPIISLSCESKTLEDIFLRVISQEGYVPEAKEETA